MQLFERNEIADRFFSSMKKKAYVGFYREFIFKGDLNIVEFNA